MFVQFIKFTLGNESISFLFLISLVALRRIDSLYTGKCGTKETSYNEVSQNEKHQYSILTHIYGIYKDGNDNPVCETAKETQMYRTDLWTLWERVRVG